jgi:6-phosphogluconolactonase/Glucosamine-6-phosphate isomerase/deaminase
MEIFISDSYGSLSKKAAAGIKDLTAALKNPVICTASGDTPSGLYKELVSMVNNSELNISSWSFVGLDEWIGMNGSDEGSCKYFLDKQLFAPLQVTEDRIGFFDGRAKDLQAECDRTENFINANGGIDVAIVGLGMNGHVGMNEPGTPASLHSHITDIDPITQQVGQKYFKQSQQLTKGITLGIANMMEARHVILLVSGSKKAGILKQVLEEEISEQLPASLLRRHKNLSVYLDAEAASLLQKK